MFYLYNLYKKSNAEKSSADSSFEVSEKPAASTSDSSSSVMTTIGSILGTMWNWSVIIVMNVLPNVLPYSLLYLSFVVSFGLSLLVLLVEGYRYRNGTIKVYPKHIDLGLPFINLGLLLWLVISPPPSDWHHKQWFSAVVNGLLFLFVTFTIMIGKPFTLQYAMEKVPKEHWNSPLFNMISLHVSLAWAFMFFASFVYDVIVSLYADDNATSVQTINTVVHIVFLVAAVKFTADYPAYAKANQAKDPSEENATSENPMRESLQISV